MKINFKVLYRLKQVNVHQALHNCDCYNIHRYNDVTRKLHEWEGLITKKCTAAHGYKLNLKLKLALYSNALFLKVVPNYFKPKLML